MTVTTLPLHVEDTEAERDGRLGELLPEEAGGEGGVNSGVSGA